MAEIVWEDPAPRRRNPNNRDWSAFVAELKEHPGKWAIAREGGASGSFGMQCVRFKREYGCEATTRKQEDGTFTLYARWPEASAS